MNKKQAVIYVVHFPFNSVHSEFFFFLLPAAVLPNLMINIHIYILKRFSSIQLPSFPSQRLLYLVWPVYDKSVKHHSHAVSGPLRWRGEVATLVGEGEAVLDESLPPPSDAAGGGLSCGTGGAFFLLRKLASNPPLLLPPSALQSAAPSSIKWTLRRWSPGLSGGLRADPDWVSDALDPQRSRVEFLLSASSAPFSPAEWRISSSVDPYCPWFSSKALVRFKLWKSL